MIDHVTYHIGRLAITDRRLTGFMNLLGFEEVEPDDPFEHGYQVRWFESLTEVATGFYGPKIHFVADGAACDVKLGLGHFCIIVGGERYDRITQSAFCVRQSGSGRAWMEFDRIRVEVRP